MFEAQFMKSLSNTEADKKSVAYKKSVYFRKGIADVPHATKVQNKLCVIALKYKGSKRKPKICENITPLRLGYFTVLEIFSLLYCIDSCSICNPCFGKTSAAIVVFIFQFLTMSV